MATRTGFSSFNAAVTLACRISHIPRFRNAFIQIVGPAAGNALAAFDAFCAIWETILSTDDKPFVVDGTSPFASEDHQAEP